MQRSSEGHGTKESSAGENVYLHVGLDGIQDGFAILASVRDSAGMIVDFRYEHIDPASCRSSGHAAKQYLGRTLLEVLPDCSANGLLHRCARVVETGEPMELESVQHEEHPGGRQQLLRAVELRGWKLGDSCAMAWRDVTARRRAQDALRHTNERLRLAVVGVRAMIYDLNLAQRQINAIEGVSGLLEYPADEVGLTQAHEWWLGQVHPEDQGKLAAIELQIRGRTSSYSVEYRVRHQRGHYVHVLDSGQVIRDTSGRAVRLVGAVTDISERKQAEENLRRLTRHARCCLWKATITGRPGWDTPEALAPGVKPFCWDGMVFDTEASRSVIDVECGPGESFDAAWCRSRLSEDDQQMKRISTLALQRGERGYEQQFRCRDRYGQVQWLHESVTLVPLERGRWHAFGVVINISAQKQAEEGLQRAKAAAEAANRAKDQFIAVLSHELRTPLTPVLATASMMESDARLPADVREDLAMIRRNIDLEVRLIADLLDVSRIISGKLHMDRRPTDVAAAIQDAARVVGGDLRAMEQTLTVETPEGQCLMVGDSARLQQVFWNLLRNASKFTPRQGTITLRAWREPVDRCPLAAQHCPVGMGVCPAWPADGTGGEGGGGDAANLVIMVSDTGKGIAPELLPRLFNAFEQARDARNMGGLGLGLAICRAVIEMHGGSISAHSGGPGRGSTFTVRLPVVAACPLGPAAALPEVSRPAPSVSVAADQQRALRILLVEDNRDTALAMRRLLRARGHEVAVADGVQAAAQAVEARVPDVLVCDIGLPDGSGLDVIRGIRAAGHGLPAIALSGYGQDHDIQLSREAGFNLHLTKPVDPVRLHEAIAAVYVAGPSAKDR